MEISLVSSLTSEDERRFAAGLLRMLCSLLNLFPIAYSVRITTTSGRTFARTRSLAEILQATGSPDGAAPTPKSGV